MEEQLLALAKFIEQLQKQIVDIDQTNQLLVRSNRELIESFNQLKKDFEMYQQNSRFEALDPRLQESGFWYPTIRSTDEALERIIQEHCSIARFGDGEFSVIAGRIRHGFQTMDDPQLTERLLQVLHASEPRLLIGLADNYGSLEPYSEQTKREIRYYLQPSVRAEHLSILSKEKIYYNAYLTRPYIIHADMNTDGPKKRFLALKKIWDHRACVFVEGKYTRLGVGNDLFENAASLRRIIAPAKNAFIRYEQILKECLKIEKDALFLIALGPTASVLAYDLCCAGYQAIDVGHVDLEYEWFLKGEGRRVKIPTKSNNEMEQIETMAPIYNSTYQQQILADISE